MSDEDDGKRCLLSSFPGAVQPNKKKDTKLIEERKQALARAATATLTSTTTLPPLQECYDRIEPYMKEWADALEEVVQACSMNEGIEQAELLATNLIQDIQSKLASLEIQGFFPEELAEAYHLRCISRVELGQYQDAVKDATHCLEFAYLLSDKDENVIEESVNGKKIRMLYMRGRSLMKLGSNTEEAFQDLRACCAEFRQHGDQLKTSRPTIGDITILLLSAMALLKKDAPRPHYEPSEREMWQEELGLGLYSQHSYKCFHCGKVPASPEVLLKLCSGCKSVWYCGKECQKASWKGGHKVWCCSARNTNNPLSLPGEWKDETYAAIAERGYKELSTGAEPIVLLRDETTGKLFDSLSNQDVSWCGRTEDS